MIKAKKILFITTAMSPFVPDTPWSERGRHLPQLIQELGHEIRTFTPKWGVTNERRNQLHEVIRLSGMNLIIDETDHPLIIKVASLQAARMQIYFIDNDDYFLKSKAVSDDELEDPENGERAIFYARGVLETVKKLRWVPDVIHCHGWIAALAPLYIKRAYQDEPSFSKVKVVTSVAANEFEQDLGEHTISCIPFRNINKEEVDEVCQGKLRCEELAKLAVRYSDGLILEDEGVSPAVVDYAKSLGCPILSAQPADGYAPAYSEFYESLM